MSTKAQANMRAGQKDRRARESYPTLLIDVAISAAGKQAIMSFEELVAGCTTDEREQLAWHLAMLRARRTFEALRMRLCDDCPPIAYPTDKTRCTPCPRRVEMNPIIRRDR